MRAMKHSERWTLGDGGISMCGSFELFFKVRMVQVRQADRVNGMTELSSAKHQRAVTGACHRETTICGAAWSRFVDT